jgi:hypothetical protein
MIKHENGMLVLSSALSKQDHLELNDFLESIKRRQKEEILNKINTLEQQSFKTRTPIYQETLFARVKEIVAVS